MSDSVVCSPHLPGLLRHRLSQPLPGRRGQVLFAPEMGYGRHYGPPAHDARTAAVLILLFADPLGWRVPLMLRPAHMLAHAGQVSFPGGRLECEESCEEAAIREFQEELGTVPHELDILGRLTPLFVFASNFWVIPILAWTTSRPIYCPSHDEVSAILEPTIEQLVDTRLHCTQPVRRRGVTLQAPGLEIEGHFVWGATAMIIGELLAVVDDCRAIAGGGQAR